MCFSAASPKIFSWLAVVAMTIQPVRGDRCECSQPAVSVAVTSASDGGCGCCGQEPKSCCAKAHRARRTCCEPGKGGTPLSTPHCSCGCGKTPATAPDSVPVQQSQTDKAAFAAQFSETVAITVVQPADLPRTARVHTAFDSAAERCVALCRLTI
jgi:hypothetical protein